MVMDDTVKRKKSLGKEKIIKRVHDKMYLTCTCIQWYNDPWLTCSNIILIVSPSLPEHTPINNNKLGWLSLLKQLFVLLLYNNNFIPEIREFFIKNIFCSFLLSFDFFPGSPPGHLPHHAGHLGGPSHHVPRVFIAHLSIELWFLQSGR